MDTDAHGLGKGESRISEQIGHPGMFPFNIFADVEYDTSKEVKYKRKPNRQKR